MDVEKGLASSSQKNTTELHKCVVCSVSDTPNVYVIILHNKDHFLRDGYILCTLELT